MAQAVLGTDNAISTLERGGRAFVPFSFPWFQYLLTIRNITVASHRLSTTIKEMIFPSELGFVG